MNFRLILAVLAAIALSPSYAAPWRSDRSVPDAVVHFRGQALGQSQQVIVNRLLDRSKRSECAYITQRVRRNAAAAPAQTPEQQRRNETVICDDIRREVFGTRSRTRLRFHDDRWVGFAGEFPSDDFARVLATMTREYGPPQQHLDHAGDNRHQEVVWQTPQGTLTLIQRSEFSARISQFILSDHPL